MPSTKKTLHFVSSALVTAKSVALLGFGMSRKWSETTMECARSGSDFFNGSAVVTLQLFDGNMDRTFCPTFGGSADFQVIPKLAETTVTPLALHALAVCLLVLCLVFSACSILISLYNSVSNPYETYMGPIGIYTCSSLSACLSVVTLIIFVVNVHVTSMAEDLVKLYADSIPVDLRNKSTEMGLGYYLVIPYTVLCLVAIALIYMYDHAAYTQRREQQRPTEDAPKEIMMY
ncbi:Clarin-3 Transmembrane protein 12 [Collichthys lucidus]|uniref:Clarin-3 Transmembrane protein 12 n=1 Tax=Collichthys lucidus TaxID=240159 RepID=A0A4U5VMU4_COLLU|nr:Clarin-3 Transmembrane protein 12 [Collichthys lucidus]